MVTRTHLRCLENARERPREGRVHAQELRGRKRVVCISIYIEIYIYTMCNIDMTYRLREREREREARRGTDATGNRNTTGEDPTHRGSTQRGGPRRGPTTGGEGQTGDLHRTHTDIYALPRAPWECERATTRGPSWRAGAPRERASRIYLYLYRHLYTHDL